jgi:hypothetical protein
MVGVLIFTVKFVLGYSYIQYLNYRPGLLKNARLQDSLDKLIKKMPITQDIIIAESKKIASPILTGYLKPIILFPFGMVNHLTQNEVEIILAHELAHIYRNDWIINMVQSMVEVLFYFHPGVWWISAHIREERENCCDDIALNYGYDKFSYARVLIKLKEMELQEMPTLAMSFYHSKNTLMKRIKRLLGQPHNRNTMREKIVALALVFTVAIAFAGTKIKSESLYIPFLSNDRPIMVEHTDRNITMPVTTFFPQDTTPRKKRSTFSIKKDDGKSYKIESENGKIKRLEIDGEVIPKKDYDKYVDEMDQPDFNFNFNDGGFKFFGMDSLPITGFMFGDRDMALAEKMEHLQEKLRDMNIELRDMDMGKDFNMDMLKDMELHLWNNEKGLQKLEMDSLLSRSWGLNRDQLLSMEEMMEKLGEMRFEEMEGLRGLEKMRELEGMEHMGDMFREFNFSFPEEGEFYFGGHGKASDKIARELNEDGLIKIGENNEVELSGKHLKINGDKQPNNIYEKYKRIFEESTGMKLTPDSKVKFDIIGKESRKGIRRI